MTKIDKTDLENIKLIVKESKINSVTRIKYEKLNKNSNIVYGKEIKSNYQNQGLKLSKHFK